MNIGKHTRVKVYNAKLLLRNAERELDEAFSELAPSTEEHKIIVYWAMRIGGMATALEDIIKLSKDKNE